MVRGSLVFVGLHVLTFVRFFQLILDVIIATVLWIFRFVPLTDSLWTKVVSVGEWLINRLELQCNIHTMFDKLNFETAGWNTPTPIVNW